MHDKVEQIATTAQHAGTAIAVGSFFSMNWWNENSAGIIAICAVIGAVVSVVGFCVRQWRLHKHLKNSSSDVSGI